MQHIAYTKYIHLSRKFKIEEVCVPFPSQCLYAELPYVVDDSACQQLFCPNSTN
jgi:hypothetical protein